MKKWIFFILLLLAVWFIIAPALHVGGTVFGLVPLALLLGIDIALVIDLLKIFPILPFKLKSKWKLFATIAVFVLITWQTGWLLGLIPASVSVPVVQHEEVTPEGCRASVGAEVRDTTATIDVNAWDLESNTPYSSAVDFTTNCYIYKNGNGALDYISASSDTSASSISGFSVGDTVYMYCGGTSYYGEPIEGLCVNQQRFPLNIMAHTIVAESNMQVTGYDNTGTSTLSAATYGSDYYMTMGAGEEDSIYLKLKVAVANKAYQFCAWGIATFYNISRVEPQNVESTYTQVFSPTHMKSIAIGVNESDTDTLTKDYTMFKASSSILLKEWDSIKEQFVVETDASNDPVTTYPANPTLVNGFAIIAKDCAWSRGGDGKPYFDYFTHDTSQADVGLAETETSPYGKQVGMIVEVR